MSGAKPVDLEHLDRYTGGDSRINAEILELFDGQCRLIVAELEQLAGQDANGKAWRELNHKLKGAARGVGAFALGQSAADAEKATPAMAQGYLEQLKRDSAAVHTFIQELLKQSM